MKVKDLIPVIEGQVEHIVIGNNQKGVFAEKKNFPHCDSVETFLDRYKDKTVAYITPMDSSYLEITID